MEQAALLVPLTLLEAVALGRIRVGFAVLAIVVGMGLAPLLPAVLADLRILGVALDLLAVVVVPAPPLAVALSADGLLRMEERRGERLLAVPAAARLAAASACGRKRHPSIFGGRRI